VDFTDADGGAVGARWRTMDVYVVKWFLVEWSADETCLSLFEGPDADAVLNANRRCDLPAGRVLDATTHRGWS
jgi:hypothetical protein